MDSNSLDDPNLYAADIGVSETRFKGPWEYKAKYKYNNLAIDLRMHDLDGTLQVSTIVDKDSCKHIPQVKIVNGFLIVTLRKEIEQ